MTNRPQRTPLPGRRRTVIHLAVSLVALVFLALILTAASARYHQLSTISIAANTLVGQLRPQDAQILARYGLPVPIYAAYFTAFETLVEIAFLVTALVIFWSRSNDRSAFLVALMLSCAAMTIASLGMVAPGLRFLAVVFRSLWVVSVIPLFFLFPDGRFVPHWTRWLALVWLVYSVSWLIFPQLSPPFAFGRGFTGADITRIIWILTWLIIGVAAQVYRYLRVSNAVQRQQTKWAVLGFIALLLAFVTGLGLLTFNITAPPGVMAILARMAGPSVILLGALALPISIGTSVLRYRLWDIDIIIRRTLLYGALTVTLALAYFSSVVLLQKLFQALTGQLQSPIVTVISTLAIAALFTPLRRRLQEGIDRRFYRQHYDSEQMLAAFAAMARDEVELENLTGYLLAVVKETMQPERLGIWLKHPAPGPK